MKYTMYLDESGHPHYCGQSDERPILCLSGCIFENQYYKDLFEPDFNDLKQVYFGSSDVVLTSRMIRQRTGACRIFNDPSTLGLFYRDLNNLLSNSHFVIYSSVIFKEPYAKNSLSLHEDPYHLSIMFIMERYQYFLQDMKTVGEIIPEARGRDQDKALTDKYSEIIRNGTTQVRRLDRLKPTCHCMRKTENLAGLQIADFVAYPIGNKLLYPDRPNPSYDVLAKKFYVRKNGEVCKVKIFPGNYENYQRFDF